MSEIEYSIDRKEEVENMDETVVMQIIADQLHISADSLREETSFKDIGADSLDLFQIISALEEAYDIEFDNDAAENMKTIEDALDYIRRVVEK